MTDIGTSTYTIVAQIAPKPWVSRLIRSPSSWRIPIFRRARGRWLLGRPTSIAVDRACQALTDRIREATGTASHDLLGELGVCGTGAAVSNAVFNATGIRVRDFPITLAKLLPGCRHRCERRWTCFLSSRRAEDTVSRHSSVAKTQIGSRLWIAPPGTHPTVR
jgi:hypothetical protein